MPSLFVSDLYFSLVSERECGECIVCCQYLSINTPSLKKPADVLCKNCIISGGCGIYETRPSVCRTWHCLWRRVSVIPLELRPDKSNVIFSLKISYEPRHLFENAYIVCMALTDPSVFDSPLVSATLDTFISEGSLPVWLSFQGGKSLVYPGAELCDAIINPNVNTPPLLLKEGKAWLERYDEMLEPLKIKNTRFDNEILRNQMN